MSLPATDLDPYRTLQVDPAAEDAVIHAAYRALARRFHPDGAEPDVHRMSALNRAYAVVRDPERRRELDARRGLAAVARTPAERPPRGTPDDPVIDFGRYAGFRVRELARRDPDYLRWLSRHSSGVRFREAIARVLPREADLSRRASAVA